MILSLFIVTFALGAATQPRGQNTTFPNKPSDYYTNKIGMVFKRLSEGDTNHPDIYLGLYEVKQSEWQLIMDENRSFYKGKNLPVEWISYKEVRAFTKVLSLKENAKYRLPTCREWMKAYAGDSGCVGGEPGKTIEVYATRTNKMGFYGMLENVSEWCEDQVQNPVLPPGQLSRAIKGNSFLNSNVMPPRLSDSFGDDYRCNYIGARIVLEKKHQPSVLPLRPRKTAPSPSGTK
jgi:formylglycine-generating enzyme required for sulfatase activity